MKVTLVNRQRQFAVDHRELRRLATCFARAAQGGSQAAPWREIVVFLLSDKAMAAVNSAIMGHDGITDVVTQRYDPLPGETPGLRGEMFINVAEAWRAATPRWTAARELALYLAHGCDHLTGADDATVAGRMRMRRRELRWLRKAGVDSGLLQKR